MMNSIPPAQATGLLNAFISIDITGEEAESFLHAQLTSDVKALGVGHAQYTAYCSPKGRMLGNGYLARLETHHYRWVIDCSISERLVKRLSMFILRSKVKIQVSEDLHYGLVHAETRHTPFSVVKNEDSITIELPATSPYKRTLLITPTLQAQDATQTPDLWHYTTLLADEVIIQDKTYEELIPQMIEWDRLGGVSFKKGCYPGQEIVARSHYLGKMKRRLFCVAFMGALPAIGSHVVHPDTPEQNLGIVVETAINESTHTSYALIVISTDLLAAHPDSLPAIRTEQDTLTTLHSLTPCFPSTEEAAQA
jgi:tRNA-modifying protein YgfZ